MDLKKIAISACALALAACGGGGDSDVGSGGGTPVGGVNAMTADTKDLAAFVGDTKSLRIFATDLAGNTIANPALTWSSTAPAVATATAGATASTGTIVGVAPGAANVVVTAGGRTLSTPISVFAPPTTADDLKKVFPYKQPGTGTVATYSDVDAAGNDARFAHMSALWAYMVSPASYVRTGPTGGAEFYFTRDVNALTRGAPLCGVTPTAAFDVGSILSCPDAASGKERWFYVSPSSPLAQDQAQMQHEISEAFFERTIPSPQSLPWLYKGMTLAHEVGTLQGGALTMNAAELKKRLAAVPGSNTAAGFGATDMIALPYAAPAGQTVIHSVSYGPAALVLFLMDQYNAQFRTYLANLSSGAATAGSDKGQTALLAALGRSATQLNAEYASWRVANGL
jgi:hypothetical protein